MRCTNPLFGYMSYYDGALGFDEDGVHHTFGKMKFVKYGKDVSLDDRYSAFERLKADPVFSADKRFQIVPCGQCIACRINFSRDWGVRCCLEAKKYPLNVFLTLTYNDEHLPIGEKGIATLNPEDLDRFWDNFRWNIFQKYGHRGIRYYECGEYGSPVYSYRPHYHALIFNLPLEFLDELHFLFPKKGVDYYDSETIAKSWISSKSSGSKSLGFSPLSVEVNFKNACYVARYCTKKLKGQSSSLYEDMGIVPEFSRMSRRPGIARGYYDDNSTQIYKNDEIFVDSVGKVRPPRYFDTLFDLENPDLYETVKERRRYAADQAEKIRMKLTDKSYVDVLKDEALINQRKFEKLKRGN